MGTNGICEVLKLRVIKQHKQEYYPFTLSLPTISRRQINEGNEKKAESDSLKIFSISEDKSINSDFILDYSEKISSLKNSTDVLKEFKSALNTLKYFFSPEIFIMNEKTSNLLALNSNCDTALTLFVKKCYANGIIDWIAETRKPQIILNELNSGYENCLIVPLYTQAKFKAILFTFTRLTQSEINNKEVKYLQTILNLTFQRILLDLSKSELNNVYSNLHSLHSKLENDFRFAALGELTYRSIEEIASPMQVILTYADLIKNDYPDIQGANIEIIKKKVYDIKGILDRLVKFININNSKPKIIPCSINENIIEFNKLIQPALLAENCELVLDLEENIPSILSCNNYLNQILINAFSLINPLTEKNGGIIIQTRYFKQSITVKMIFTKSIEIENLRENQIGINILKSLMEKHEGEFLIDSKNSSGSTLTFSFPLIRKVRA